MSSIIKSPYFFVDRPLAIFLHQIVSPTFYEIAKIVSFFGLGGLYVAIFSLLWLLSFFILKKPYWIFCSTVLLLSVVVPGLCCNVLKMILGRSRPDLLFSQDLYGFYFFHFDLSAEYYSFPSGHATTIAGVAMACYLLWRRFPLLIVGVATLVILSRVILSEHFLSDIMMGAYLGSIMTCWIYHFLKNKMRQ